jgi:AraC family transcriptional regulator of adaptative response/methylated-DNA-[protein]-cysteine methyltransferase
MVLNMSARPPVMNLDDDRWQAIVTRDHSARFVYAVRTTGVYCRPGCGARRPRREHVSVHPSGAAARRAGFRPCLRCQPDQPEARSTEVAQLCRLLEAEVTPTLAELGASVGKSPFHTQRLFKAATGLSPRAYAAAHRAARARQALGRGDSVTAALHDAGYGSSGRFYAESNARLGMTPTAYRRGGVDLVIRFAVTRCSLGQVLVAATARGICAVLLGDSAAELRQDLVRRFARAELRPGDRGFARLVQQVVAMIERPSTAPALPLDIRGTAFQERVWRALAKVRPGTTVTYAAIARALGMPKSSRAVGQAIGANPIAVAIPCHRVLRSDGSLCGYRWGPARKRALLEREGSAAPPEGRPRGRATARRRAAAQP